MNATRRTFLKSSAVPLLLTPCILGANGRITVGSIGVCFRANLLIGQLPKPGQIVARCNCDEALAEEVVAKRKTNWDVYNDYRWLLDRKSRWV